MDIPRPFTPSPEEAVPPPVGPRTIQDLQTANRFLRIQVDLLRRRLEIHQLSEVRMGEMLIRYREQLEGAMLYVNETQEITLEALAGLRDPVTLEPIGQGSVPWVEDHVATRQGSEAIVIEPTSPEEDRGREDPTPPMEGPQENGWHVPRPRENGWHNPRDTY